MRSDAPLDRQALHRVARELEQADSPDHREAARALRMLLALQFHGEDLEGLYRKHAKAAMVGTLDAAATLARTRAGAGRARLLKARITGKNRIEAAVEFLRELDPTLSLGQAVRCVAAIFGRDEADVGRQYRREKRRRPPSR